MKIQITRFLFTVLLSAMSPWAASDNSDAEVPTESAVSRAPTFTTFTYKLRLPNAADSPLSASADYQLQGVGGKPIAAQPDASLEISPPQHRRPLKLPFHDEVLAAAQASGLEPAFIHAVISVESAHNPAAVSPKGAVGLMQLMPGTAKRYGVKNSKDPGQNIRAGTQYLIDLKKMFGGDLSLVLAAYNAGENAVLRYGRSIPRFPETLQYIPRVFAEYGRLRRHIP